MSTSLCMLFVFISFFPPLIMLLCFFLFLSHLFISVAASLLVSRLTFFSAPLLFMFPFPSPLVSSLDSVSSHFLFLCLSFSPALLFSFIPVSISSLLLYHCCLSFLIHFRFFFSFPVLVYYPPVSHFLFSCFPPSAPLLYPFSSFSTVS